MTDLNAVVMQAEQRKTPKDVTDFEREQLRFLLTREDLTATLVEINPSLAWLPALAEMNLLRSDTQLAPWIEKNFADPDAIRDVAANIHFFDADTANILDFRLSQQAKNLRPVLVKSWRLIIRHMRTIRRGFLRDDWFELVPRLKQGERSPEVLERLADVLRPKLKVGKRISWHDEQGEGVPQRPSDLMSIEYEIDDSITEQEVLSVWSASVAPEVDERLLVLLTAALNTVLEDAIDAGVESNRGYSTSDLDVPSVARHEQNAYRSGFQPIVRVMADVWTRLASKSADLANSFVGRWAESSFRLVRRLALFAAANAVVPAERAADILLSLPPGELFLSNSSVEVYRLLCKRWPETSPRKRQEIEARIIEGPPPEFFREGADIEEIIDRDRFDLLGNMQRAGLELGKESLNMLAAIRYRRPHWQLRPAEQAGFHIWQGRGGRIEGSTEKLEGVPNENLIDAAKQVASEAGSMEGGAWQALCRDNPARALGGLRIKADQGEWPEWAWTTFLSATQGLEDKEILSQTAAILVRYPKDQFGEVTSAASWWLDDKARNLDEQLLWPLWDLIEEAAPREEEVENA